MSAILCRSFNGWPVSRDRDAIKVSSFRVDGVDRTWWTVTVAHPIFARIIRRWNREVDPIVPGVFDDWSYNVRPARTQDATDTPRSNHGSGTAVDIDAAQFPAKTRRMTTKQRAAALRIEAEFGGLVVWGGRWKNVPDEMHWELAPGTTPAKVRAKILELGLRADGTRASATAKPAAPLARGVVAVENLHYGKRRSLAVKRMQYRLNQIDSRDVPITGNYDDDTDAAVRRFQRRIGDAPDPRGQSSLGPRQAERLFPQPPYKLK
jgi:hypothetical protein